MRDCSSVLECDLSLIEMTGASLRHREIVLHLRYVTALLFSQSLEAIQRILNRANCCTIASSLDEDQAHIVRDERGFTRIVGLACEIEPADKGLDCIIILAVADIDSP